MTTVEKAREYSEKAYYPAPEYGWYESDHEAMMDVLEQAYLAGATEALASQWVSVEDWLPEDEETVLTLSSYGPVLAYYSKQDEMWFAYGNYGDITPTHWLSIPPLKGGDE